MSTAIVEYHVTLLGPGEHQALTLQVEQLHLVDLELVCPGNDQRLTRDLVQGLFLPFAGLCIAMVHADLISVDEHSAHPATRGQKRESQPFENKHGRAGQSTGVPSKRPGRRKQDHCGQIREHVLGCATLAGASRWDGLHVINEAGDSRNQRGGYPKQTEIPAGSPPGWVCSESPGEVEEERAVEKGERKRDEGRMYRVPPITRFASHRDSGAWLAELLLDLFGAIEMPFDDGFGLLDQLLELLILRRAMRFLRQVEHGLPVSTTSPGSIEEAPDHGSNTDMKDFREKQDFLFLSFVWDGSMRKHILKRAKEGTSGQILELLRRSPMTVDELAAALGVTRTAVRAQLATLERDEFVEYLIRRHGCPLAAATANHPEVCNALESMLSVFVGSQVNKCCDRYDRVRCCFEISSTAAYHTMKKKPVPSGTGFTI